MSKSPSESKSIKSVDPLETPVMISSDTFNLMSVSPGSVTFTKTLVILVPTILSPLIIISKS